MYSNISHIEFDLTGYCNLNCSYCYLEGRNDKDSLKNDIIERFFNQHMASVKIRPSQKISFWGGEPLLNFDSIKSIVNLYNSEVNKRIKTVSYQIITNGTLIDDNIAHFCKLNNIHLQITIDGDRDYHNLHRKYKNNKGTYDKIIKNVCLLNKYDVKYKIRVTLTAKSPPPSKIIYLLKLNKIKNVFFALITPTRTCNKDLFPVNSSKIIDSLFSSFKENNKDDNRFEYLNILRTFDFILSPYEKTTCGIDGRKIAIKYNGDIYPCHRFIKHSEYKIGNVWDGIINNKFTKVAFINNNENCSNCEIKDYCGGSCAFELLSRNDKNYIQDDICQFRKGLLKNSLKILIESSKRNNYYNLPVKYLLKDKKDNDMKNEFERIKASDYITKNSVLKKSQDARCIDLGEEGLLFSNNYPQKKYVANTMTMAIWDLINEKSTINEIVSDIAYLCNIKSDKIYNEIYQQLIKLKENKLIELVH